MVWENPNGGERLRADPGTVAPEPRVFCTRPLPGRGLQRLAERAELDVWPGPGAPSPCELLERTRDAEGLLCLLTDSIRSELIANCPRLRVISSCSVGLDHIDVAAASARGIPVGFTPGVLVETTADLAFGLLLASARRIPEAERFLRTGQWSWERRWEPELLLGGDVHGATLGLIGLGAIGQAVARRAAGFDMRLLGWTRSGRRVPGVELVTFDALLRESDLVSLHVALTPETRGLIGASQLAQMRSGAFLVNTSRGGVVDELALLHALESGHLGGAALDVFAVEPIDPSSPLLRAPNLILTPHIGSASIATRTRMADLAVENLLAGLEGRPLPACANPKDGAGDDGGAIPDSAPSG
jgi:glyoxylate reductase